MEVSFPNSEAALARVSGHHTPETLAEGPERSSALPGRRNSRPLLYHIKPSFQGAVERECARLRGVNLTVCALGDHFIL